jgi:hypothetical protein
MNLVARGEWAITKSRFLGNDHYTSTSSWEFP